MGHWNFRYILKNSCLLFFSISVLSKIMKSINVQIKLDNGSEINLENLKCYLFGGIYRHVCMYMYMYIKLHAYVSCSELKNYFENLI